MPADPLVFVLAALGLTVSLVAFGVLLGLLSGNANQINTFGGLLVIPVVALCFAVLIVDSGVLAAALDVLPFTQGTRLLFDAIGEEPVFAAGAVAWCVLGAWTLLGFALLARVVGRREL